MFAGRSTDAESTVLPSLASYIGEALADIPEARSFEDHGVVLWLNMPTAGIVGASKYDFMVTALSNLLTQYKKNSIAILVHPNRAGQLSANRTASIDATKSLVHMLFKYVSMKIIGLMEAS